MMAGVLVHNRLLPISHKVLQLASVRTVIAAIAYRDNTGLHEKRLHEYTL
jgi:hypothetical protein